MYRFVSNIYPKKLKKNYSQLLMYAGINLDPNKLIGVIIIFSFLISLMFTFYLSLFFQIVFLSTPFLVIFLGSLIAPQILIYFWLLLKSDAKTKFVEEILPDVLQLMSSNLRSGMTTDKALLLAARPEFGPFQTEIKKIGKEITIGKDLGQALLDVSKRIDSERLKKTMTLIVSGLKSGGELASLLDQTAKNLRRETLVDNKVRANVMMYVIFIFVAVCFGAPFLFGLSSFLVEVLTQNLADIDIPEEAMMDFPINISEIGISVDFVIMFSLVFLTTSAIFGSLIIGSISKGKEREGLKFLPIILLLTLGLFLLIRYGIRNVLGGFFGF